MSFVIRPVRDAADLVAAAGLMRAYAAGLGIDLGYQDFEAELAGLPGRYAPPEGELLLARGPDGAPLGCAALRGMDGPGRCEMKRLFVTPQGRGLGLGRALVLALVDAATRRGYAEMWLDTLPDMHAAQALYRALGFSEATPYYDTPIVGTLFMRRTLAAMPA